MLRAWWRDHQATPSFVASAVLIALVTAFAAAMVPAWGDGPGLPLWALVPGTLSMLQAPCALSQLAIFDRLCGQGARQRRARWWWAIFVVACSALACTPIAAITGQASLPRLTGLLVALTFALSSRLGMASAVLGAGVDVLAFTYASRIAWVDPWRWLAQYVAFLGPLTLVLTVASLAVYAWTGPAPRRAAG